jgi:hypothetical protein
MPPVSWLVLASLRSAGSEHVFSLSVQFVRVQVKFFQIVDITVSPCPILQIPMRDGLNEGGA